MYVPSNTPKYVCYACRNKIPTEDLEAVFQEQLRGFLVSPEEIAKYLASANDVLKEKEDLLKVLEIEQTKLQRELDQTMQLYLGGKISRDGFASEYGSREERLKQLKDQIPTLQGDLDFLKIQYLSRDEIMSEARDLASRWPTLPVDEKRQIIENITEKITITKDEVLIDLCYLPSGADRHPPPGGAPSSPPAGSTAGGTHRSPSRKIMAERQRGITDSSPRPASRAWERWRSFPRVTP
jgi:site-specific DNA recombinase